MSKKLIVTERQLRIITQHINETDIVLNELLSEGIIEEGFKEIALGILMLAGVTLTGQNKAVAQNALIDNGTIQQISATLSDTNKLNKVISKIDSKMPNASEFIQQNIEQIKATINYISDKNSGKKDKPKQTVSTDIMTGGNTNLDSELPSKSIVTVQDIIDFKWSSDNFFQSGTFELNQNSADSINTVINGLNTQGGKIVGVHIESSTDKEPIKMGNNKLAQLRANSVEAFIKKLNIGDIKFGISVSPDNGPDLYKAGMDKIERVEARIKTAPYRFINIRLAIIFDEEAKQGETVSQVIERHQSELPKINDTLLKSVTIKYSDGEAKKTSCKKIKSEDESGELKTTNC